VPRSSQARHHILGETRRFVSTANWLEVRRDLTLLTHVVYSLPPAYAPQLLLREHWCWLPPSDSSTEGSERRRLLLRAIQLLRSNTDCCLHRARWIQKVAGLEMELLEKYCTVAGVPRTSRVMPLVRCSQWMRAHPAYSAVAVAGIGALVAALVHHVTGDTPDSKPSASDSPPAPEPAPSSAWGSAMDALGPLGVPAPDLLAMGPPPVATPPALPTPHTAAVWGLPRWITSIGAGVTASLVTGSAAQGVASVGEAYTLRLDSKFMREFEAMQAVLGAQEGGARLEEIVSALEDCGSHNVEYREWLETAYDRECPVCLGVLGPGEDLARSQDPNCGAFHLFHRRCLPNKVRMKGCPVCCRPMPRIEPGEVSSPFAVEQRLTGALTPTSRE